MRDFRLNIYLGLIRGQETEQSQMKRPSAGGTQRAPASAGSTKQKQHLARLRRRTPGPSHVSWVL